MLNTEIRLSSGFNKLPSSSTLLSLYDTKFQGAYLAYGTIMKNFSITHDSGHE